MNITRLRITNYRAIKALDTNIGPRGAIAKGGNARGKTTILRAIRAALLARDVGPDAIHEGADSAEILINVEDPSFVARRRITPSGSTLSVETSTQDVKRKPQTYLSDLLGTAAVDPLELFLSKPADRKKLVLAAMPAKVTRAEFEAWIPEELRGVVPDQVRGMLVLLHGVDACAALHKVFFDARGEANAGAKSAKSTADYAERGATELRAKVGHVDSGLSVEAARRALDGANALAAGLVARKQRVEEQSARFAHSRETVRESRATAAILRGARDGDPTTEELQALSEKVERLRIELIDAETSLRQMTREHDAIMQSRRDAKILEERADELEKTIAAGVELAPSETEFATAKSDVDFAAKCYESAVADTAATGHETLAKEARQKATDAVSRAEALTAVVDRLRVDAPRELLEKSAGIPGLGIDGDTLTLDGKSIDAVSGNEQMFFAVEVARRANALTKILIVDGLERLDADALPLFVDAATSDGFQLIATRVERGEMVIEAIESNEKAEAAE